jgi:hypothetical protein
MATNKYHLTVYIRPDIQKKLRYLWLLSRKDGLGNGVVGRKKLKFGEFIETVMEEYLAKRKGILDKLLSVEHEVLSREEETTKVE